MCCEDVLNRYRETARCAVESGLDRNEFDWYMTGLKHMSIITMFCSKGYNDMLVEMDNIRVQYLREVYGWNI